MPSTPLWSPSSIGKVISLLPHGEYGTMGQSERTPSAIPPSTTPSVASESRPLPEARLVARRKIKDFLSSQTEGNAEDPRVATAVAY